MLELTHHKDVIEGPRISIQRTLNATTVSPTKQQQQKIIALHPLLIFFIKTSSIATMINNCFNPFQNQLACVL